VIPPPIPYQKSNHTKKTMHKNQCKHKTIRRLSPWEQIAHQVAAGSKSARDRNRSLNGQAAILKTRPIDAIVVVNPKKAEQ
jgi:hypothetical protein